MKELIILVGPPGSGKSTLAKTFIKHVRISQDDQGKKEHLAFFITALAQGNPIIVDRMDFNKEQRSRYIEPARKAGYTVKIIVLQVPRAVCLARMASRKDHPTIKDEKSAGSALNTFFKLYERPTPDEADVIEFDNPMGDDTFSDDRDKAIIVDLDGTLCNIDHRLHFVKKVEGKKSDWKNFFYNIPGDSVNPWCEKLIRSMKYAGYEIVYASGRPSDHYNITKEWLEKHGLYFGHLYMRERNDFRQDYLAKETILDFELETRFKIEFIVDDRKQVVEMWRKRGYTCLQCDEGEF